MNQRTRITISADLYRESVQYATADHRTFSELVSTALMERMHRFPKKEKEVDNDRLTRVENRLDKLSELVGLSIVKINAL